MVITKGEKEKMTSLSETLVPVGTDEYRVGDFSNGLYPIVAFPSETVVYLKSNENDAKVIAEFLTMNLVEN